MKVVSAVVFLLVLAAGLAAQDQPEIEDEQTVADYADYLAFLMANPVNLNHAGLEQLMVLPGLTPYQALRLDRYLKAHPGVSQPYQLVADSVLSLASLESILPYICFDARDGARPERLKSSFRMQRRMPGSPELADGTYPGNAWESRSRGWLSPFPGGEAFIQFQHDPGEPDWADYQSGCFSFRSADGRKKAVVGDYQVQIGQGLLMGGVSPIIFSSSVSHFPELMAEIKPYYSSQESRGLRGAGFRQSLPGGLSLLGFLSRRRHDARVDSQGQVLRFYEDGYHRSSAELARKDAVREDIAGARLGWGGGSWPAAGLTYVSRCYDKDGTGLFSPWMSSLDWGIGLGELRLAGELVRGPERIAGYGVNSLFISGDYSGRISLYGYSPGFLPPRFNGESYYGGEDERGGNIQASWGRRRLNLAAAYNQFYPWQPAALSRHNSRGSRYEVRAGARLIKGLEAEFRIRSQARELHQDLPDDPYYREERHSARSGLRWQAGRGLVLNCRYDTQYYLDSRQTGRQRGELLAAGFRVGLRGGLRLSGQSVIYHVPDYRARIYLTEPELVSGGSFHGYWGRGTREALAVRYGWGRKFSAGLKIARQSREYKGESTEEMELGFEMEIVLK